MQLYRQLLKHRATSCFRFYAAAAFLKDLKQYVATSEITTLDGYVPVGTTGVWVTFYPDSMNILFGHTALVKLPYTLPIHKLNKIFTKHDCYTESDTVQYFK